MNNLKATLTQFSKGNQLAFRRLYELYNADVYRVAFYILKVEKYAEEVVQDSFLKLWDNRNTVDVDGSLNTYLYVICRNLSFNKLKQLKREQKLFRALQQEDEYLYRDSDHFLTVKEFYESFEAVLDLLPERQRTILRLSRLEGFSHKEIAEQLCISTNTVKNHMVQALKTIKNHLESQRQGSSLSLILFFFTFFFND